MNHRKHGNNKSQKLDIPDMGKHEFIHFFLFYYLLIASKSGTPESEILTTGSAFLAYA